MKQITKYSFVVFILISFFACNTQKKDNKQTGEASGSQNIAQQDEFVLKGEFTNKKSGYAYMSFYVRGHDGNGQDSAKIVDGKFEFRRDLSIPRRCFLVLDLKDLRQPEKAFSFYATNETITLSADINKLPEAKIEGDAYNKTYNDFLLKQAEYANVEGLEETTEKYYKHLKEEGKIDKDLRAKWDKLRNKNMALATEFTEKYVKDNPKSILSLWLIDGLTRKKTADYVEHVMSLIDVDLMNTHILGNHYYDRLAKLRKTDVGFEEMFPGVKSVAYKTDKEFDGTALIGIKYLSVFTNNNIAGLKDDGSVLIIDPNGKVLSQFKTELEGSPGTIAVDEKDNIYITYNKVKVTETKFRGKKRKKESPDGIGCKVYNKDGKLINSYLLNGLETATGSKAANGKLFVSSATTRAVGIYDIKDGKEIAMVKGLRSCCGIMDIGIRGDKEILVANLGAFRVSTYDFKGNKKVDFGQRGREVNDFHGCCNPVSLDYLSNGAIVTVEKDPTRIKIFSQDGAKTIDGIEELVVGCAYIPMTVDSKDNIYLASPSKGVVKCVAN